MAGKQPHKIDPTTFFIIFEQRLVDHQYRALSISDLYSYERFSSAQIFLAQK